MQTLGGERLSINSEKSAFFGGKWGFATLEECRRLPVGVSTLLEVGW